MNKEMQIKEIEKQIINSLYALNREHHNLERIKERYFRAANKRLNFYKESLFNIIKSFGYAGFLTYLLANSQKGDITSTEMLATIIGSGAIGTTVFQIDTIKNTDYSKEAYKSKLLAYAVIREEILNILEDFSESVEEYLQVESKYSTWDEMANIIFEKNSDYINYELLKDERINNFGKERAKELISYYFESIEMFDEYLEEIKEENNYLKVRK